MNHALMLAEAIIALIKTTTDHAIGAAIVRVTGALHLPAREAEKHHLHHLLLRRERGPKNGIEAQLRAHDARRDAGRSRDTLLRPGAGATHLQCPLLQISGARQLTLRRMRIADPLPTRAPPLLQ
ncbi:hypothetical protein MMC25_000170 [Agyrium rufum]|nr:hypothetical protein [Agyrium rufum]